MSLSGQLGDLSLAELIEFFCNLRKTGRLKVEYPSAPGVFYFKEGELVDAQLGSITGTEAVYHALTLPGAAFDFNTHIYASRRTINEPWMQLVLEGLRRVDETGKPGEHTGNTGNGDQSSHADDHNAFHFREEKKEEPSLSEVAADMDDLHRLEDGTWAITSVANPQEPINVLPPAAPLPVEQVMPTAVGAAAGGRRRTVLLGAVGALLVCVVAVTGLANWFSHKTTPVNPVAATPVQPDAKTPASQSESTGPSTGEPATSTETATPNAARVEPQVKPAPEKYNAPKVAPKTPVNAANPEGTKAPVAQGSKTVMVQVTVDEAGRVSQASVANSRPGMESYESSAIRAARQRRYPAGKSGVITVPVKIN